MPNLFSVTYDIVTPESAADGDVEDRGFISQDSPLRNALQDFHATRTSRVDGVQCIEPDDYDWPRWITVYNGTEFETGANESRSLCIPPTVTRASARRIAKLCGARL